MTSVCGVVLYKNTTGSVDGYYLEESTNICLKFAGDKPVRFLKHWMN